MAVGSHRSERSSASPLIGKKPEGSSPSDALKKSEPMDITGDDTDSEHKKQQKQLYHIRHKLQKLVYEKKPVSSMDVYERRFERYAGTD